MMVATKKVFTGHRPTTPIARAGIDATVQANNTSVDAAVQADKPSVDSAEAIASAVEDDANLQFDNDLVYALSCIRYIREHAHTESVLTDIQRKHLYLLDGIALLLVTGDKSDVAAAVSFVQNPTSIDFYYAKIRPCTVLETEYV